MQVIQMRLLRGPNMYAPVPCLMAVVDVGALANGPVIGSLATLVSEGARGPAQGEVGDVLAATTLALQNQCGDELHFCCSMPVAGMSNQRRIVVEYAVEHVAQAALRLALQLIAPAGAANAPPEAAQIDSLRAYADRFRLSPPAATARHLAQVKGIPVVRTSEHADLLQIGTGTRQVRFAGGAGGGSRLLSHLVCKDRFLSRVLLSEANIPIPDGATVARIDDALLAAKRLGPATLLKPRHVDTLLGPTLYCRSADQLEARLHEEVLAGRTEFVIERLMEGSPAQAQVCDGVADGALTRAALAICAQAAAKLGVRDGIVEVIVKNNGKIAVTDVQPSQNQTMHLQDDALQSPQAAVAAAGSIPTFAITGTNGKTTTTRMIAHAVRSTGQRTGFTTTQGIFIGDEQVATGDCTGYWSHRAVLSHPSVEVAVLETARGGLLKRGLAFERCAVGVMLNVSDDHLGLDGVDTVTQLAAVKALVAKAGDVAVLNADDPYCLAIGRQLRRDETIVYFSMDADNPVIAQHLGAGHKAVFLRDELIVRAHGTRCTVVMPAAAIPATLHGKARFNIANALAAVAALSAANYTDHAIATGLASFVSDARSNPLRANVFTVNDIKIVLDYAHNPAAYTALGTLARAMTSQRVLAVVTSPGDRRDDDLLRIGATCAQQFDQLFVYESASRGRAHGAAAALIAQGAGSAPGLQTFMAVGAALTAAYAACLPGDVLVFACGTSVQTLIDALAQVDPQAAQQIQRDAGVVAPAESTWLDQRLTQTRRR